MKHKFLASILALSMLLGLLPGAALAAESDEGGEAPVICTLTEDCAAEIHDENCPRYVAPEEPTDVGENAYYETDDVTDEEDDLAPLDVDSEDTDKSGSCGATEADKVTWTLTDDDGDSNYTLTISGEGAMADYNSNIITSGTQPWRADETGIAVTAITKIVVAEGVTKIGAFAFNGVTNVTEYDIAATVSEIGDWSIETSSAERFILNGNENYKVDGDGVLLTADEETLIAYPGGAEPRDSYTIPSTVKTVASGAFVGCDAAKLVIPSTVTSLPQWSFSPSTIQEIVCNAGMETLPDSVFANVKTLEKISFGSSIKTLPTQTVYGCKSLRDVDLPDGLTSIGLQAFMDCSALSGIAFPESLQSIGKQAFIRCTSLSGVEFPEGLTTIGVQAFSDCSALTALVFPDSLVTIGANAFKNCTGLAYVVHGSGIDEIGGDAFSGCTGLKVIDIHRAEKIGDVWQNGLREDGDSTLNNACQRTLENVRYYMRSEAQAKAAKGDIEWGNDYQGGGNITNTYYALTAEDAVPDYSGTTDTPQRTGYTFNGWKAVTASDPQNVYTDEGQWQENSYEADEDTATITQMAGETSNGSATLKVPETQAYNGQPKAAVVETTGTWTGGENITYAKQGETEYTATAPVAAGSYTAKLTVGEGEDVVTVSVDFEITKAEPAIEISAYPSDLTGGGTVKLTVSGVPEGGTVTVTQSDDQGSDTKTLDLTGNGSISVSLDNTTATYTFTVSYDGSDNYESASKDCTVSVTRYTGGGGGSSSSSVTTYPVTVDSGKNGTVTSSAKNAKPGATVTLTVTAKDGYELDDLTVTDKNGKAVKVTEGKNGKFTFTMPAGKVTVEATFAKIAEDTARRFTDVPDGHWAEDAIEWAADNGYMNGNTAATFNPDGTVTRQQLWMILARLSGYQPADFAEAKAWAVDNRVSDGSNPGNPVSRQQLVTILYRYAVMMGYKTSGTADLTRFPDHASVAAYATDAMSWSVANGIVGGTTAGTLNPTGTATRAQFAVILMRFVENLTK